MSRFHALVITKREGPGLIAQELRLRFLQCREAWLVEMLVEVEEGPAHDFLKRVTDIHRLHLFDIIMQFRALFAEEALSQVIHHP